MTTADPDMPAACASAVAEDGVRSLERGLALLRTMNADPGLSISELARRAGIPRATAYRLLNTLQSLGYVERAGERRGLKLTAEVRRLSDGYVDENWLEAVWPELHRTGCELYWPLSLLTFQGGAMVIRRTTHAHSTMSIDHGMTGRRMPLTETAAGLAYLAFCPAQEREWLLDVSATNSPMMNTVDRDRVRMRLARARADGFGRRIGGPIPRTASISVPVMRDERVLCCISVVWIASAQTIEQGVARLAGPLEALGRRVEGVAAAAAADAVPGLSHLAGMRVGEVAAPPPPVQIW